MSIEVRLLEKKYGEQKALDNISFSVHQGEIVGFLGPNGAGKSTTMKIITGYLQEYSGEAFVCGINVREQPHGIKKKIGYLPEANPLYLDMYVREYLGFIAEIHREHASGIGGRSSVNQLIELVGLSPESKKKIGQLSKGYKQRVGLAAALIHDPEVLILDEPTSGLDPNQIIEIRELIRKLGQNKTVLFSSHILQEAEAICNRIIIINKGKIVADSKLADLHQKNGGPTIRVAFKEAIDQEKLSQLNGVRSVKRIDPYIWELQSDTPAETKNHLLELSLQNSLNIVSLQDESQRLEDIFKNLTNPDIIN